MRRPGCRRVVPTAAPTSPARSRSKPPTGCGSPKLKKDAITSPRWLWGHLGDYQCRPRPSSECSSPANLDPAALPTPDPVAPAKVAPEDPADPPYQGNLPAETLPPTVQAPSVSSRSAPQSGRLGLPRSMPANPGTAANSIATVSAWPARPDPHRQAHTVPVTDRRKAATLLEGHGFRCLSWLVGEFGDCVGPQEVLVGAQIAHSLDVERVLKVLGIARAHTLERQRGRQRAH